MLATWSVLIYDSRNRTNHPTAMNPPASIQKRDQRPDQKRAAVALHLSRDVRPLRDHAVSGFRQLDERAVGRRVRPRHEALRLSSGTQWHHRASRDRRAKDGVWPDPIELLEQALAQEQDVTRQINDLYELALIEKDFATLQFLTWFLQEQVEEENTVSDIIDRLRLAGDNPAGLLRLDDEAGRPAPSK